MKDHNCGESNNTIHHKHDQGIFHNRNGLFKTICKYIDQVNISILVKLYLPIIWLKDKVFKWKSIS